MEQASRQFVRPEPTGLDWPAQDRLPKIVIHFAVMRGTIVSWRLSAAAELRVHGARIWLTRIVSPYDYWMQPGDVIRLYRGERIWLSVDDDADRDAEVSLTSGYAEPCGAIRRRVARLSAWFSDMWATRAR